MADDDDDEIGRQIVGAVRREIEPAHGATIVDLQKSTEQLAFAAARATAEKPALQGRPKIAFFDRASFAGPDLVGGAHGLMVSISWLSANCRILAIRLGRLPPRTSAFFACASHVSRQSLSPFLTRGDRRLQPTLAVTSLARRVDLP